MIKRDVQVLGAVGLAGWLLLAGATTAWAQPTEATPAATEATPATAAVTPAETSAASETAPAATPPAAVVDKTDKPGGKTDKPGAQPGAPATGAALPPGAKPGAPATGAALPPGTSIKVERTARGAKLFRITEGLVVEGQMQRPNAFLVLQRATVDYDYEALSASFLPRIVAATREKPF